MTSSKTANLYSDLKERLLNGAYAPASKLTIELLAGDFGVSPSSVREALSRLTSDGLVRAIPQRGFVVAEVSREELRNLTEVRLEIEAKCLSRSIRDGDLAWEARLLSSWHLLSRTGAGQLGRAHPEWSQRHKTFHDELVSACSNLWWLRMREGLFLHAERYRRMLRPDHQPERDIEAEHRELLELALARDEVGALAAQERHLLTTVDLLERVVSM